MSSVSLSEDVSHDGDGSGVSLEHHRIDPIHSVCRAVMDVKVGRALRVEAETEDA